jgi:hypothetical protein
MMSEQPLAMSVIADATTQIRDKTFAFGGP